MRCDLLFEPMTMTGISEREVGIPDGHDVEVLEHGRHVVARSLGHDGETAAHVVEPFLGRDVKAATVFGLIAPEHLASGCDPADDMASAHRLPDPRVVRSTHPTFGLGTKPCTASLTGSASTAKSSSPRSTWSGFRVRAVASSRTFRSASSSASSAGSSCSCPAISAIRRSYGLLPDDPGVLIDVRGRRNRTEQFRDVLVSPCELELAFPLEILRQSHRVEGFAPVA
jgi:hypothetical protein